MDCAYVVEEITPNQETKPMSKDKYTHAFNIIENWESVESLKGSGVWSKPSTEIPEDFPLRALNDPKQFRLKREPRRVWVNYYDSAEKICVLHLSKEGAEAEVNDEASETAVEFVEVLR